MSLLLDALKRAELEKRKNEATAASGTGNPGRGEPPTPSTPSPRRELSLETPPARAEAPPGAAAPAPEHAGAAALFEAKALPGNPRAWLWGFAAIALASALGGGLYVWREMSRPPLLIAAPARAPSPDRAPFPSAPASPTSLTQAPAAAVEGPANPGAAARPAPRPVPTATTSAPPAPSTTEARTAPSSLPTPAAMAAEASAPLAAPSRIRIERTTTPPEVDPALAEAYQALQAGDLGAAEGHYRSLLVRDRRNRDALLGLAAIAVKRGESDAARRFYRQALALNPRDPLATAGLAALEAPASDPVALESQLKILLAGQPEAAALHFALGNLYATQSRWSEAQQAYFQAFKLEPANADYAYNLAVSLDHLKETALAGQYYRRALALAAAGPAAFDSSQVEARLRELGESGR